MLHESTVLMSLGQRLNHTSHPPFSLQQQQQNRETSTVHLSLSWTASARVDMRRLFTAPLQTSYRSSLTGFLTCPPLRVVYWVESLASAAPNEGIAPWVRFSWTAGGSGWWSCAVRFMCVLAWSGCTTWGFPGSGSGSVMLFAWRFQNPPWDLAVSVLRATLLRLIRRPPRSTTYDRGEACCCTTVAALYSFDPGSGFTLTWSEW